jgi:uncharacterized membrane protein YciS (DUF1049 family)
MAALLATCFAAGIFVGLVIGHLRHLPVHIHRLARHRTRTQFDLALLRRKTT